MDTLQPAGECCTRAKSETAVYEPRDPGGTVLYQAVLWNLETFLEGRETEDRTVPVFVERELRAYLKCGVLAQGFARFRCDNCGADRLVSFSCYLQRATIKTSGWVTGGEQRECGPPRG